MTYWIKLMYIEELRSLQDAITERTVTAMGSVSISFARVEHGDIKGLSNLIQLIELKLIANPIREQYLIARGC
ncbi:hypothetical protein [Roseixanthobacter glucoisosaccharinicivorans]|uniref:hypothetical protein n=1 Tax=Roseixanthobacter glucoisosaccharinicivorans TaxID=3119923 RepID=UPI0037278D51